MTDKLVERIKELNNPSVIGIDTAFDYLPENMRKSCKTLRDVADAIIDFNASIIEQIYKVAPSVKVQVAYYEMYGVEGMRAFKETLKLARDKGLIVISDVKRNDIGATASCYSTAYLGNVSINGNVFSPFESDFVTVNGYLGEDGIKPFIKDCISFDKGIFVLAKTSNPSSGQLQDRKFENNETLYEAMGALIESWGSDNIGKSGYSKVGAVVGATYPSQSAVLRKLMPHTFFLVPGYGAQGATADDLMPCFSERGDGAIVNSSRGILCAYRQEKFKGLTFDKAAREATYQMKEDLNKALSKR